MFLRFSPYFLLLMISIFGFTAYGTAQHRVVPTAQGFVSTNNHIDVVRSGIGISRGEVKIGFQQSNNILPIHAFLQKTFTFSVGVLHLTSKLEYSKKLVAYLASKDATAIISITDLLPVVLVNPTPES